MQLYSGHRTIAMNDPEDLLGEQKEGVMVRQYCQLRPATAIQGSVKLLSFTLSSSGEATTGDAGDGTLRLSVCLTFSTTTVNTPGLIPSKTAAFGYVTHAVACRLKAENSLSCDINLQ